jgi:hypothetical protein
MKTIHELLDDYRDAVFASASNRTLKEHNDSTKRIFDARQAILDEFYNNPLSKIVGPRG